MPQISVQFSAPCQSWTLHKKRSEAPNAILPEFRLVRCALFRANVRQVDSRITFLSTHLRDIIQALNCFGGVENVFNNLFQQHLADLNRNFYYEKFQRTIP
jgi:hypothetical protein